IPGTGFQGFGHRGGVVKNKPAVTGGNDGAAYIAVRDTSDGIWIARVLQNSLTGWFSGGGVISTDPQIASLGNRTNCTLVLDSSGGSWYRCFVEGTGNGWQTWNYAGGVLQSSAPAGLNGVLYFIGKTPATDLWWWNQSTGWASIGNGGVITGLP